MGRRDAIAPWAESQQLLTWFAARGASVSEVIHDGGHELRREEIITLLQLLAEPVAA
ncbi:MAG: hypothetical protein AAF092_02485 [Pseudomonadota bacterium]